MYQHVTTDYISETVAYTVGDFTFRIRTYFLEPISV